MDAPKAFISYSWSNPSHEQWVIGLASELRESGIDVILDKWDLKEGHDAIAFMEKMVTDPEIKKVIIVCDQVYKSKADGRSGGVGTETQIISKEVYENQEQDKFVVVVAEKDENGKPYLPTYYKSRIYIDLSESDKYAENFERLIRWLFDKPLYIKPELGNRPTYLDATETISLGTTAIFKRVIDAIKNNKPNTLGALDEYLNTFSENLERFRLIKPEGEFDEAVIKSINDFIPYRNEFIQLLINISQYAISDEYIQNLHRFFERLLHYTNPPEGTTYWNDQDYDNFKFILHELFLYTIAILIKHERFEQINTLLTQKYYLPESSTQGRDVMVSFTVFSRPIYSLGRRNERLSMRRLSLQADLLKQRSLGTGIDFRNLMQADFVLFLRSELSSGKNIFYGEWRPNTLVYAEEQYVPFEIFARSTSTKYFEKTKRLLGIETIEELNALLLAYRDNKRQMPKWDYRTFNALALLGYDRLEKLP